MMKRAVGLPLLAAMLAGLLSGCDEARTQTAAPEPPRPVLVMTVAKEPVRVERSFTAVIRARVESGLGFRIPGKVVRRLVENGQRVRQGEPLAELDDTDLRLQLGQAEAEARASAGSLTQADAELRRALDLRRRGFAADANVERARAAADEARGRAERAKQAVELAANGLAYTVLRADADGIVTGVAIEPGAVLAAGQVAFRLARTAEREAEIAVPETLLDMARRGAASVTIWSEPDLIHAARLRELSPTADPVTRTYLARFSLPDLPETVSLGMSATLTLAEVEREPLVRIPLSAVRDVGSGPTVWVVDADAGRVEARPITIARSDGADVHVSAGLAAGERIVRIGVHKLDPALPVRIVDAFAY
jgi:RND family efflux transporter MFP subunit